MNIGRTVRIGAVASATALLATACIGGGGDGRPTLEIVGNPSGIHAEALREDLARISEQTGIDISYTSLPDFETVIWARVAGGNPPDLAIFPQPGLILDMGAGGAVRDMNDVVDVGSLTNDAIPGLADMVRADDGAVYGLPYGVNVKSLVWYPKEAFEAAGYEAPSTHSELLALGEQMKADGITPWCFGMEAGPQTGWPATDWIEEYVLRIGGPEVYDQWVRHEIPFDHPVVVQAGEMFEELILSEGNAFGGRNAILSTNFGEAANPLFTDPPGCMMHRQGNFITGFWPAEVTDDLAENLGVFVLPPVEGGWDGGQPVMGAGDFVAAFTDNENIAPVLEIMSSPEFGESLATIGDWLSPQTAFDGSRYANEILARQAELAANADVFRYDASDLMPGQVGTGSFWTQMVAWVGGETDLETALARVDASWPAG